MIKKHQTPKYLINRFKQMLFQKLNPKVPWLTEQSIFLLNQLIRPDDFGIEFGSGRSTMWFADRCRFLISIEHHTEWYQKINDELKDNTNVDYRFATINSDEPNSSGYANVLKEFSNESVDFILNDGRIREIIALQSIQKLRPGGIFILDNAERYIVNDYELPESIGRVEDNMTDDWRKFRRLTKEWRKIWTVDGVSSTLILFKS